MDVTPPDEIYWRSFLLLERQFLATFDAVEFDANNSATFSMKYRSIILQACSDIEIVIRLLLGVAKEEVININGYTSRLKKKYSALEQLEILFPFEFNGEKSIHPWEPKNKDGVYQFWDAYNLIKHQGMLAQATLENTLLSLSALFSVSLLYYCQTDRQYFEKANLEEPNFFDYPHLTPTRLITENPGLDILEKATNVIGVS